MKMFKKVTLTILGVIGIAVATIGLTILVFKLIFYFDKREPNVVVPSGYYKKEEYFEQETILYYIDYCKYYYTENEDYIFENDKYYEFVNKENMQNVISYFEDFDDWYWQYSEKYDFDISQITEGDYVNIYDKEGTRWLRKI